MGGAVFLLAEELPLRQFEVVLSHRSRPMMRSTTRLGAPPIGE